MTAFAVGRPTSCAKAARPGASQSPSDVSIAAIVFTRMTPPSAPQIRYGAGHLIGRLNDLRIHLIGALGGDQVGDLRHRIDVGGFEISLLQNAERGVAGHADRR